MKTLVFQTNRSTEIYFDISNTSQAIQYETKNIDGKILIQIEGQQQLQPTYTELIQHYTYNACKDYKETLTTLCLTEFQESYSYELLQTGFITLFKAKNTTKQTQFIISVTIQYNNGSNVTKEIITDKNYYYDDDLKLTIELTYHQVADYQNIYNILYNQSTPEKMFKIPLQYEDIKLLNGSQPDTSGMEDTPICTQFPLNYKNWKLRTKMNQNKIQGNYVVLPPNGQCNYSSQQQVDQLHFYVEDFDISLFSQGGSQGDNEVPNGVNNAINGVNSITNIAFKKIIQDVHLHLSLQTQNVQIVQIQQKTDFYGKLLKIGDQTYVLKVQRMLKGCECECSDSSGRACDGSREGSGDNGEDECSSNGEDNDDNECSKDGQCSKENDIISSDIREKQINIQYKGKTFLLDSFIFNQQNNTQIKYLNVGEIQYNDNQMGYLTYKYGDEEIYIEIDCQEKDIQFNTTFETENCDLNYHRQINNQCFSYCENDTYFKEQSCQQKICQSYKPYFNTTDNTCSFMPQNSQQYELYQTIPPMEVQCVNGQFVLINGFKTCECQEGYQTTLVQNGVRYMCTVNKVISQTDYPDASIGFLGGDDSIFSKFMDKFTPAQQTILTVIAYIVLFILCLAILSLIARCCVPKQKKRNRKSSNVELQFV